MKSKDEKDLESLPYPESDIPAVLQRTIYHKLKGGEDEGVDEEKFREALDRAIESEPCDPKE